MDFSFLTTLESVIDDRISNSRSDSYTASLVAAGPKRLAQKVGEEGVELVIAAVDGSRTDVVSEAADLVYHLMVLLRSRDISLLDLIEALESRHTG